MVFKRLRLGREKGKAVKEAGKKAVKSQLLPDAKLGFFKRRRISGNS